jgi:hypothetical protein
MKSQGVDALGTIRIETQKEGWVLRQTKGMKRSYKQNARRIWDIRRALVNPRTPRDPRP